MNKLRILAQRLCYFNYRIRQDELKASCRGYSYYLLNELANIKQYKNLLVASGILRWKELASLQKPRNYKGLGTTSRKI